MIIGIGFARYATRTIEALEFVRSNHGIVVAITDSLSSPLASVIQLF
ncbi:SIS domain-containing protein [Clostridium estertheticum]|nr:SIS domain-containing protein [Clostridium estertheticum]MBX4259535.1 SIS domain-containing protein [Clostridium estertheticum]WLC72486.1 SIS domain-containing protein [Clostridium estertheticum]WLC86277.1 SIS domain-containing protein [Clostridium estertheticum]